MHSTRGLDTLTLQPLMPQRVRAVLRQWTGDRGRPAEEANRLFWQLAGDERLGSVLGTWLAAGSTEDAFWSVADIREDEAAYAKTSGDEDGIWRRCVPDPRSLLRLAANPFMLNMLYLVWCAGGELPKNRGELFSRFIDRLLAREGLIRRNAGTGAWERDARADLLIDDLASVAWAMQGRRRAEDAAQAGDLGVLTVLPRDEVIRLLRAASPISGEDLLKIAEDATLLEGDAEIRFRHQLLQEYFTAVALRQSLTSGRLDADQLWPREHWWVRSGWEEAVVLLAGLHSDDCTPVIRWLKDCQPELAAQCILEGDAAAIQVRDKLLRALHDAWLPRLVDIDREPAPEGRAAIGRALGRLGLDDRKGVGRADGLPDTDWVECPGGEFIYQDGQRRACDRFWIARYPVTHVQFQAFLDAGDGNANDRWWAGMNRPDRSPWSARWPISNHPREMVSWFEAVAFCTWLSHRLGLEIRLPTEWEWERAARGSDGRVYPWGDAYEPGYANVDERYGDAGPHCLGRTSPVGIYPQGASPEGVSDLSGNVWEWCLNEWSRPESIGLGGSESRVVRGGSWLFDQDSARADYRLVWHPDDRDGTYGFRELCVSPIR